jgi:hypothetical protein
MGECPFESIEGYKTKLEEASFDQIEYFDMTELNGKALLNRLYIRIEDRDRIINAFGEASYHRFFFQYDFS